MGRSFPQLPTLHASWAPVFLEPIMHSGERLTIGIAAAAENGETIVVPTLSQKQLSCIYGQRDGEALFNIVQLSLDSLSEELKEAPSLQSWESPFSGVIMGQRRETVTNDLSSLVQVAMRLTASLSALTLEVQDVAIADAIAANAIEDDRWPKRILDAVVQERPQLREYFNRSIPLVQGAPPARFDFFGRRYVANFGRLIPSARSLSRLRNSAKWKLWDLARLRDAPGVKGNISNFDLILWRPAADDMAYTENEMRSLSETIVELTEEARSEEVSTIAVFTADQARQRILELEAA